MAVSIQETVFNYVANGVTVDFAYGCQIFAASDLIVFVDDVQVTTGFTVNGVGVAAGGSVTFTVAPANAKKVRLERIIKLERTTAYQQSGDFLSRIVNPDFDRLWMALQRINYFLGTAVGSVARVLKLGDSDANGTGAYRAHQNRIQDLADPIAEQDATNKRSVISFIEAYMAGVAGGIGAFIQFGFGAVMRTFQDKMRESVTLADFGTAANAVVAASGKRLIIAYGESVTLNVPAQFATAALAFTALKSWIIQGTATIKVADGTHVPPYVMNHTYGENIKLIGNEANPDLCVFMGANPPTTDGLLLHSGFKLGYLNGFKFDLPAKAVVANNFTAICAVQNSTIICGPNIKTNNWYYGIAARDSSYIYCPYANVNNAGDVGIWAFCGSTIVANNAQSNNASDTVNGYGFGFQAEFGSTLVATAASATGCYKAGFAALSNSTCRVHDCIANANTGSGFLSWAGGQVEAYGSSSTNNTRYGIEITEYGNVIGIATNTGNTLGTANPFAYLTQSGGQARLASSTGPLRVDADGSSSVFFNNADGLNAEVRSVAASTSRMVLKSGGPSTSDQPSILADGPALNISGRYDSKGTGSHYFNTGGGNQFQVFDTVGAINQLAVTGSTGGSPRIQAVGASADIDVMASPKGANGRVRFGVFAASADVPCVGTFEMKTADGIVHKVMCST